ncbi:hypothetical protein L249_1635, partial [Ophiocordyceps polyrhachis-furcata BCC 54312]
MDVGKAFVFVGGVKRSEEVERRGQPSKDRSLDGCSIEIVLTVLFLMYIEIFTAEVKGDVNGPSCR